MKTTRLLTYLLFCCIGLGLYHIHLSVQHVITLTRSHAWAEKPFPVNENNLFLIGAKRKKVFLTIGIPTVMRSRVGFDYLKRTLDSIVLNTPVYHQLNVTILIFAADIDITSKKQLIDFIFQNYQRYLDTGFMQIMQIRREAYPALDAITSKTSETDEKVRWRSKQVMDYAFMFYHGQTISDYYIQIHDDVMCSPGFIDEIKRFILSQPNKNWVTLDISMADFLGQVYRTSDLERLARFLMLFHTEKAVDFILLEFSKLLAPPNAQLEVPTLFKHEQINLNNQQVQEQRQQLQLQQKLPIPEVKPVQEAVQIHDKIPEAKPAPVASQLYNKLKDHIASPQAPPPPPLEINNPAAVVYSTMMGFGLHTPDCVYDQKPDTFFWATDPKKDDDITLVFNNHVKIKTVTVRTGHPLEPKRDYLQNGVLEASSSLVQAPSGQHGRTNCGFFSLFAYFSQGNVDIINPPNFPVKCLRIRVTQPQQSWVMIPHIKVVSL